MLSTLSVPGRVITVALVIGALCGAGGGFALAQATPKLTGSALLPLESIHLETSQLEQATKAKPADTAVLAHHEGATSAASSLLGDGMSASDDDAMDSLWGSMIAGIAYRRDPQMRQLLKRAGRANELFLLSVASISGLSLAQSISGIATMNTADSHAHGEEEHGGGGQHHDSLAPSIMGLVGGGLTLGSIGAHEYFGHRYQKKIEQRRKLINARVLHVLDALEAGPVTDALQTEMVSLIGARASREFMHLWNAAH